MAYGIASFRPTGGFKADKSLRLKRIHRKQIKIGSRKIRRTQEKIFAGKHCPECFTDPMGANGFCKTCIAVSLVKY